MNTVSREWEAGEIHTEPSEDAVLGRAFPDRSMPLNPSVQAVCNVTQVKSCSSAVALAIRK